MDEIWLSFRLLLLLAVANVAPIVAKRLLDPRWCTPLDGGLRFFDGRPLFGPSKTVRGALAGIFATAFAAPALSVPLGIGALIGAVAMAGDALSSFAKRRLGIASSGRATGIDQIPECLLPLLAVQHTLNLSASQIFGITLVFFVLEIVLSRLLFRFGLRDRPY